MREFLFKYNNIDFQDLKTAHELSYTSWNNIINQLREQTNNNTTYAETLQTWLFGSHELPYIYTDSLGDATNFYDYIQECLRNIKSSIKDLKLITANKLNKVSTPTIVYATDSTGISTHILYSVSSIAKAIVQRDEHGKIKSATPVSDDDTVNKKYVEDTFVKKLLQPNKVYGTDSSGADVALSHDDLRPNIILRYPHSDNFPAVGDSKKFYLSEYDGLMYYWNGVEYRTVCPDVDFDVIDGGNADEYDIPYDIFDGGGA